MEEEDRVAGRDVHVVGRVTTNGVVPTTVNTQIPRIHLALHCLLEVLDIVRHREKVDHGRAVGVAQVGLGGDVADQAAGVPVVAVVGAGSSRTVVQGQRHGTEVDRHVGEGARVDAATTMTGGQVDGVVLVEGEFQVAAASDVFAVAAHTIVASIKDWR